MTRVVMIDLPWLGWDALVEHVDRATLPALGALVERGVAGPVGAEGHGVQRTGTVMTGAGPGRHRLFAEHAPRADGLGLAPAGRGALAAPPFWEYLDAAGLAVAAVNMPATLHSQLARGVVAADLAFKVRHGVADEDWGIPPGAIWPLARGPELAELRLHPEHLLLDQLEFLLAAPVAEYWNMAEADAVHFWLAEVSSAHGVATHLLEADRPDLLVVRYPMPAWPGTPPRPGDAPSREEQALRLGRLLDAFVARLVALAGDASIFVVGGETGRAFWLATGAGIAADTLLAQGARLADLAPTILARFGFDRASHMSGRALDACLDGRTLRAPPMPEEPGADLPTPEELLKELDPARLVDVVPTRSQRQQIEAYARIADRFGPITGQT